MSSGRAERGRRPDAIRDVGGGIDRSEQRGGTHAHRPVVILQRALEQRARRFAVELDDRREDRRARHVGRVLLGAVVRLNQRCERSFAT